MSQICFKDPFQPNSFPWIAPLLREEDIKTSFINSQCSAVLVSANLTPKTILTATYVTRIDNLTISLLLSDPSPIIAVLCP